MMSTETVQENGAATGSRDDEAGEVTARQITDNGRRIRQAVVVIHGIGEQRPMDTLRSFVDAVLDNGKTNGGGYLNKPDRMNELFETRCLQARSTRNRPVTDFYEYYWAHHMRGSKYSQVVRWLLGMMRRSPRAIPGALLPAYLICWGLLLTALALWVWAGVRAGTGSPAFVEGLLQQKALFSGGLVSLLFQWACAYFILGYVADAARYFTPSPDNIEARNKIRSEGIKLLRTLHASGKYSRIVVVGHSLGSVIGYDIIRNLWVELRKPEVPFPQKQPELMGFEHAAKQQEEGEPTPANVEEFQQCQQRLWQEYRRVGMPWLITDFITLGSPLAHAQLLMADSPVDFELKKQQYEFPCCPPKWKEKPYYSQQYSITRGGESVTRSVYIPDHGAPFSCIRWSNLYFPYRRLIFGDLIGGPLSGVFGKGIRDMALAPASGKFLDRTLLSHVRYWTPGKGTGEKEALKWLRHALGLDFLRGKGAKVKPGG
jgi:hypothetical protein